MSYTQFSAQASCEVVKGFNLDSFLNGLMKRCVQEDNFIADNYGVIDEELCDLDFHYYVTQVGNRIQIHLDTEEGECGDSEVFEWLTQQFIPVMTSRYLRVDSVTVDSRDGTSCFIQFYGKNGDISVDDLLAHYEAYIANAETD
jgi:hypothetical protein